MENSTLRDCLSYDSTLNYFLWSSNVDSLKILVSEILKNTAIASAEVNEDKHHKMLSFKVADSTIMHLSMLSPRVGGAGYPREID